MPVKSSLIEFRQKISYTFFKNIYEKHKEEINPFRRKYRGFYIYSIDGDHLELPASTELLKDGFRGFLYRGNRETHYPKMYTVQAVDVVNGMIKDFSYSTNPSEVSQARQMVASLEKESIAIYDRLHCSYKTVWTHEKACNHFLIRVRSNDPKLQANVRKFCQSSKRSCWLDLQPCQHDRKAYPVLRVRLVKVKNPRSKKDIVLMTNLLNETFSNKDLGKLYQRRWAVESSFKDLTSTLKMSQLHSKKLNGILQEIYALLWLVNSVRMLSYNLEKTTRHWLEDEYKRCNFKICIEAVMSHLDVLVQKKVWRLAQILETLILRTTEKRKHLSRAYPRQVRSKPKPYKNAGVLQRRA